MVQALARAEGWEGLERVARASDVQASVGTLDVNGYKQDAVCFPALASVLLRLTRST